MRSKQLAQGTFDRHHAVVIGGSMTGLLAARVLSDHFGKLAEYWDANAGLRASCPNLRPIYHMSVVNDLKGKRLLP